MLVYKLYVKYGLMVGCIQRNRMQRRKYLIEPFIAYHTTSNCFRSQGECKFVMNATFPMKKMKAPKFIAKIENLKVFVCRICHAPNFGNLNGVEMILIENKTGQVFGDDIVLQADCCSFEVSQFEAGSGTRRLTTADDVDKRAQFDFLQAINCSTRQDMFASLASARLSRLLIPLLQKATGRTRKVVPSRETSINYHFPTLLQSHCFFIEDFYVCLLR